MLRYVVVAALVAAVAGPVRVAGAAVPSTMHVQGALTNGGGALVDGTYAMTFRLFATESSAVALWSEPVATELVGGAFSVTLGTLVALPDGLFQQAAPLWLAVQVETEPALPRRALASVAYALEARRAEIAAKVATVDGPPAVCDASNAGAIYFDAGTLQFMGCNTVAWVPLSAANVPANSPTNPGLSCKDILDAGAADGDGTYWLDPNGAPHNDAFEVHCDMTSAGGGWTLVAYNYNKSRTFLTGTYHAVSGPLIPTPGQEAAVDPDSLGLKYTQIGFYIDDPQWAVGERTYHGFWVGMSPTSTYNIKSNACQLLSPTLPTQWPGQLVYFAGDGSNDNGCTGGGSVHAGGHTCDDGGGGVTTNNVWPQNGSDALWGYNCVSSYSPTGAYKSSPIPNQGLHAYYVR